MQHLYTVVASDTLRSIAQRFYGDENQWPRIFNANRDQIDDPDVISVGQVLLIPLG
jgi:nucleoid-associated protein YgaU